MKTLRILVVGNGVLGSALVELFIWLGHQVECIDEATTGLLEEIAARVDVVFVAVPVSVIAEIVSRLAKVMLAGSLIISCGSVAEPAGPSAIDFALMRIRGIAFALLHLMFRPVIPLAQTIFGENFVLWMEGDADGKWRQWIIDQFSRFGPIFHEMNRGEHDRATVISQLFHMLTAIMLAKLWNSWPNEQVNLGAKTGGFPCQSVIESCLRSCQRPDLVAEIISNHPLALEVIETLKWALDDTKTAIVSGDSHQIEASMAHARGLLSKEVKNGSDFMTSESIRFRADYRKEHLDFDFPAVMNKPGLLAKVMTVFDERGIDKTSTYAHNLPDGGCRFIIGVEEINERVQEAEDIIRGWIARSRVDDTDPRDPRQPF